MAHLVLVRHGKAAAGFDADADPGLDDAGRSHAEAMADALALFGPLPLWTSPLRRTRETAAPLAARWGVEAVVEPGVGEIVAPTDDLAARGAWLRGVMGSTWSSQSAELQDWRRGVVDTLVRLGTDHGDGVVISHFVAINVAVGAATGDDRVTCFAPGYCSRTELRVEDRKLSVGELGEQAATTVRPG